MHFRTAFYRVAASSGEGREGLLLELGGSEGIASYSELAPLPEPGFSRETLAEGVEALESFRITTVPDTLDGIQAFLDEEVPAKLPSLRWAMEILLSDYAAKRANAPLAQWWGAEAAARSLEINGLLPRNSSMSDIQSIGASGFRSVKLKASPELLTNGRKWLEQALASLPRSIGLRLDGNRSFELSEARDLLRRISSQATVEYFEEPLKAPTLASITELQATSGVPFAFDESLWLDRPLVEEALDTGNAKVFVLKPCMLGGFYCCRRLLSRLYLPGATATLTSTMEIGPAYIAGVHAALALSAAVRMLPCGFDTLKGYEKVFVPESLRPKQGKWEIENSPGLGKGYKELAEGLEWKTVF